MPAYSFKERFVPFVKNGSKTQTIRAKRKYKIKVGDPVYLYYGMRTKHCIKIGEGVCTKVDAISINDIGAFVNGILLTQQQHQFLAIRDGFENYLEMERWWQATHQLPFSGDIIHWKLIKNI